MNNKYHLLAVICTDGKKRSFQNRTYWKSGWRGKLTEGAQADMRDWFWVDSPDSSGYSSDPAEYKPSEHV